MGDIEKIQKIRRVELSEETYFTSLLKEGYKVGMVSDQMLEHLQLQGIELLGAQCQRYTKGESSSVMIEVAETIMESILYVIALYLKSLPDADTAILQLQAEPLRVHYEKGCRIFETKKNLCRQLYRMLQNSKLDNPNYAYNATLSPRGLGRYFKRANGDFTAQEVSAAIDYQLCIPVFDFVGVEYMQKYMENLLCENQFCNYFDPAVIHHLLFGFDDHYEDLLINLFEQVFTTALGCVLLKKNPFALAIEEADIPLLYNGLNSTSGHRMEQLTEACQVLLLRFNGCKPSVKAYCQRSLPKIATYISKAVETQTLHILFPALKNPEQIPGIAFSNEEKMDDEAYRRVLEELRYCEIPQEKADLIKSEIHTLGDLEDVLLDANLSGDEMNRVFGLLEQVELAALIKYHSFHTDIVAEELSEGERTLRSNLQGYFETLPREQQGKILKLSSYLIESK